ncbi:MAG TPA: phosphoribosylglycinamide formyltransferase [Candidatus Kapabacteria bacterium]|nr:phosphoribosylglycinamide formyltransferase [Candidatus Kapabacteria bacterium]HOV91789.1 phosphoribosylglycinamide formyltransferase [Candidatus Kapabacteria bacterium]
MANLRLAVFASHEGTNLQALIDAQSEGRLLAEIVCVISNNSDSGALRRAKVANIPAYHISEKLFGNNEEYVKALMDILNKHNVNLIILAGYMKRIPVEIIKKYQNHTLNIHPALLPKYGGKGMYGLNVHKAVIEAGEKVSGATVHIVNEEYDKGRILNQVQVEVLPDDTPETLAARILPFEHQLYVETINKIARKEIILE